MAAGTVPASELPRQASGWRGWLVWAIVGLVVCALLVPSGLRIQATILEALTSGDDFYQYWTGGQAVAQGASPYGWLTEGRPLGLHDYHYPPLLALLLAPFAAVLDFPTARWGWLAFSVACLAVSGVLIWRLTGLRATGRTALALAPALALWPATSGALAIGQLSPQLLLLITLAGTAVIARRSAAAGVWLTIAAYVKTFPALLGGYLLLRRQWRAACAATALGLALIVVSLLVLGPDPFVVYLTRVVPAQPIWFGGPFNLSVTGLITRLFVDNPFTTPVADLGMFGRMLAQLSVLALVGASGWAIWRAPRTREGELTAFALAVLAALLASPINGEYNLVIVLLPLAVAAARVQRTWPVDLRWLFLAALLLSLPTDPCDLAGMREWCLQEGASSLSTLPWRAGWGNLLTAGPLAGLLVLWALLLRLCLQRDDSP